MVRSRSALVVAAVSSFLALLVSGCSDRGGAAEVVVVERAAAEPPAASSGSVLPATMTVGLRRFLASASSGLPVERMLAGDRLVVVTPTDLLEVDAVRARGDVRMLAVGVPGACAGPCRVLLGEVFAALESDLEGPLAPPQAVLADPPLDAWPTLGIDGPSRRWRVSFDGSGRGVFVVELLAGAL